LNQQEVQSDWKDISANNCYYFGRALGRVCLALYWSLLCKVIHFCC